MSTSSILERSAIKRRVGFVSAGQIIGGLFLMIAGAELFFRFAFAGTAVKALSLGSAFCGIVMAGWRRSSLPSHVVKNAVLAAFFGIYAATAATRYPGLLKAGPHPSVVAVLPFSMVWALAAFLATTIVTFATYRIRSHQGS